jgi:succinyl-CoA synthetase beta subunit
MEIEEVAHATPELIYKEYIEPATGFEPYQARRLAFALGLKPGQIAEAVRFMISLYRAFIEIDSTLMEINPGFIAGQTAPPGRPRRRDHLWWRGYGEDEDEGNG